MEEKYLYRTARRQDGAHIEEFKSALETMIAEGAKEIILDMQDTIHLSSVSLRLIIKVQKTLAAENGKLILRNVSDSVMEVFDLVGFSGLLYFEDKA